MLEPVLRSGSRLGCLDLAGAVAETVCIPRDGGIAAVALGVESTQNQQDRPMGVAFYLGFVGAGLIAAYLAALVLRGVKLI
jgi:hypothetical protein